LEELIRALEIRYAGLQHPESARIAVNVTTRGKDENGKEETLGHLSDRIRQLCFMATRLTQDRDEQLKQEEELCKSNFLRCLPVSIRNKIGTTIETRRMGGFPEYGYPILTSECEKIEKTEKSYTKVAFNEKAIAAAVKTDKVGVVTEGADGSQSASADSETVRLVKEMNDKNTAQMTELMKFIQGFNTQQGRPENRDRRYSNDRNNPQSGNRDQSRPRSSSRDKDDNSRKSRKDSPWPNKDNSNSNQARAGSRESRPRSVPRSYSGVRINFQDLNIEKGECAKCGFENHFYNSDYCPLKKYNLTSKACACCNKGGHSSTVCPRVTKN
jgi:hypothetical protein